MLVRIFSGNIDNDGPSLSILLAYSLNAKRVKEEWELGLETLKNDEDQSFNSKHKGFKITKASELAKVET